jgi:hypothetical protein
MVVAFVLCWDMNPSETDRVASEDPGWVVNARFPRAVSAGGVADHWQDRLQPVMESRVSEAIERAHETIEEHAPHSDRWARGVAVLISVLAAVLAMSEIGGKAAQNAYLTHHIALSNEWAFYQAKNQRAIIRTAEADVLASLPNAADPAIQARIKEAHTYIARMQDDPEGGEGMKQLAVTAKLQEVERDEAVHRYHSFEYAVGALEIAIVLASVSIVTRMRPLTLAAAVIGALASAASLGIATNLF